MWYGEYMPNVLILIEGGGGGGRFKIVFEF